jgi:hypothetical protein
MHTRKGDENMPVQTMKDIAEHSLFKAALPIVTVALVGSISWIFVTVMDLDRVQHRIEDSEIPQINKDIALGYKKIDELEKSLTELRIRFAQVGVSPGHPGRNWGNSDRD